MKHNVLLLLYVIMVISLILLIVNIVGFYNGESEFKPFLMRIISNILIITSMVVSAWEFKKRLKKEEENE